MTIKNPHNFQEIIKKGYTLDQLYVLYLIHNNIDVREIFLNNEKINTLYKSLIRKGLLTEDEKISVTGEEIITLLEKEEPIKLVKKINSTDNFELFWENYPATDTFTYKNKKFTGSRGLRINKKECKIKFDKIVNEGIYTAEQITNALKLDVQMKLEASIKEGVNKITYMQNSATYLNQKSFEPFIELLKQEQPSESTFKGTDI